MNDFLPFAFYHQIGNEVLVMSPGVTGKSERAGHNSVALPTAAGRREGDRICPALTDFPVTQGDIHSTAVPCTNAGAPPARRA